MVATACIVPGYPDCRVVFPNSSIGNGFCDLDWGGGCMGLMVATACIVPGYPDCRAGGEAVF